MTICFDRNDSIPASMSILDRLASKCVQTVPLLLQIKIKHFFALEMKFSFLYSTAKSDTEWFQKLMLVFIVTIENVFYYSIV